MKYEVYLTKSNEVADIIAKAFEVGENGVKSIGYGISTFFGEVPAMFQNAKTFCCVVRYNDNTDVQPYRLIIA